MAASKVCAECRNAERVADGTDEPVVAKVRRPNDDRPNLSYVEHVCEEHLEALICDYGDEVKVLEEC